MSRKLLWVGSLLAIAGLLLPAASALAVTSGGFGGRPAHPDPNNPRSESIFIYTIEGGETKEDQVLVANNGEETTTIAIYAVDGVMTNTGAYTCKQKSEDRSGVGEWLKLSEDTVTLGPAEKKLVDFTLTMPENADVGEHNGCLVFENADDQGEVVDGGALRLRSRSAVRVVATIPGELKRSIEIDSFNAKTLNSGKQQYDLTLQNIGNVSADVDAKIRLTNMLGEVVYENGGGYPVFSNQKLDVNFTNEERPFWGGWFKAQATIAYDKRAGTFGTNNTAELITKHSNEVSIFIMPSNLALLIMAIPLVLLLAFIVTLIWRSQVRRRANKQWSTYIVQQGDTIESVAEEHGVSWQRLASINEIDAPYVLMKGQELKAPVVPTQIKSKHKTGGTKKTTATHVSKATKKQK